MTACNLEQLFRGLQQLIIVHMWFSIYL